MRRLRRILFNAATALSLLLCVATVWGWARSDTKRDVFTIRLGGDSACWIECPRGSVQFVWESDVRAAPVESGWEAVPASDPLPEKTRLGFGVVRTTFPILGVKERGQVTLLAAVAPAIAVVLVLGILPALWVVGELRRRRRGLRSHGRCPKCGYDLRATPDRCPECGQVPLSR